MESRAEYDLRYLAGIQHFNRHEYFEAHEVWEDLWNDCPSELRRFYQSLIQAAVALYHWSGGNWRGAQRLFHSGRRYMSAYPDHFQGLDRVRFWKQMETALFTALQETEPDASAKLDVNLAPLIELNPIAPSCLAETELAKKPPTL